MSVLQWLWFALIGFLVIGYAVLDGFDLGIGVMTPFLGRDDAERGALRSSIGPVWDGNEVWLVALGGGLFAAFPFTYAFAFSGFYFAILAVLFGLILRAVSIEFRHHGHFRTVWDAGFFVGSLVPALVLGVAVGNLIRGVPMAMTPASAAVPAHLDYSGSFFGLLNPYALLVGLLGLALFVWHGLSWAAFKTEGELQARARRWRSPAQIAVVVLLVAATVATAVVRSSHVTHNLTRVAGWVFLVIMLAGLVLARYAMMRRGDLAALLGSAATIVGLVGLWGAGSYPLIIAQRGGAAGAGLTVHTSSSHYTLVAMLIIAVVATPLLLAYHVFSYRTFAGKVRTGQGEQY